MSHNNEKTYIYLEIIFKSLEFFENAVHNFKKPQFYVNIFQKPLNLRESLRIVIEASISLKMSSKSLVMFKKASNL
jgi:hypothetical protein